ncbi:MAG: CocE/NonD family hydrolase [Acidobacteria bacterium]|nr:CocE/NonD family hydrolase [Acidobacteriota bacterium]
MKLSSLALISLFAPLIAMPLLGPKGQPYDGTRHRGTSPGKVAFQAIRDEPPVRIFVMGKNVWRSEREWPLSRAKLTKYYFRSPSGGRSGDLSTEPPGDETPSSYLYDPRDPVRSIGGNHSADSRPWHLDAIPGVNLRAGSFDQRPNERRDDVLVFTTPLLDKDTEVTGPVEVKLYAATDSKDTDWVVRLLDVHPDGASYNLTEGVLRARFRQSIYAPPSLLEPGSIYEYRISLLPTSNVFLKGHRIRVHVTSSNWPLIDRNPNTGSPQGRDAAVRAAHQRIYHDQRRPSHIVLPVLP